MSTSRRIRLIAGSGVLAVASAVLTLVPSSGAHAATTGAADGGTLAWGISTYLNSANFGRPNPYPAGYVAPATFDSTTRVSSWGDATGTVEEDGSADLTFAGTSVNFATTSGSWLQLSDLQVEVDGEGNGTLSGEVTYGTAPGVYPDITYDDSTPTRGPERVDLVDLSGNTGEDVAVAGDSASWTALDGTWSAEFVDFIDGDSAAGIAGFAYSGQVNSNTDRTPQPLTITVDRVQPHVDAQVTGANYGDGLTLAVTGSGFRAVTNPGDAGVYVGLAPSGGLPDVSSPEGMGAFAAADYVTPGRIVDGSFTSALTAPTEALDESTAYSIYTWQAHSHSNTTQDTETPVEIDWAALEPVASTVTPGGDTRTTYGRSAVVTAAVPGKGTVTLTGLGAEQDVTLDDAGTAAFTVPATLGAGSHTATLTYSGGGPYTGSSATASLTVTRATTRTSVTVARKPTATKPGKAKVSLTGGPTSGKVRVTVKGSGSARTTTVKVGRRGTATVVLRKAPRGGRFTVTASYAGDANHRASSDRTSYRVPAPRHGHR